QAKSPELVAARVATLVRALYGFIGSKAAFTSNGAVQFVRSAAGGAVRTADGLAGIRLAPGALGQDAVVAIERLPYATRLPTTLPQFNPYYEFTIYPKQPLRSPAILQISQVGPSQYTGDYAWTVTAHPDALRPGRIQVQALVRCTLFASANGSNGGMLSRFASIFSVRELYAQNDTSAVRPSSCSSANDLSPHGTVVIYDPKFDVKQLKVAGACSAKPRVRNFYAGDIVVRYTVDGSSETGWLTLDPGSTEKGRPWSETLLQPRTKGHVRFFYGPKALNAGDDSDCTG
ncbi:MAG: hypothetical protein H0W68_08610, partial [Gemmatimonadaceae bacterium]|nr:hypothetical protein [Gemmatimonadaceae bacterium]